MDILIDPIFSTEKFIETMKFGKEFASQMVPEWQPAYMNYNYLKTILKEILIFRQRQSEWPPGSSSDHRRPPPKDSAVKRRSSFYRAFSGLTSRCANNVNDDNEDEVILVSAMHQQQQEEENCKNYQTIFLRSSEEGGEYELAFFRILDSEFNKVINFYKAEVDAVVKEAEELNKQMDALIALRIKVDDPDFHISSPATFSPFINERNPPGFSPLEAIQEIEMSSKRSEEVDRNNRSDKSQDYKMASTEVLNRVKINISPESPGSTLHNIFSSSNSDLSFSNGELRKAQGKLMQAFIEFYQKLRLLKSYSFLNQLAFSKIMKKYDKITSRNASKAYLEMVENSYLSQSDEVAKLIERVEAAFIKHFCNGNRHQGMNNLRPKAKQEKHRVTFFTGCFVGCSLALVVAIISTIRARNLLESEGRGQYMNNIFPLYILFGFIVLHMLMYAGNVYYWKRFRINYSFIFGFKPGTELGYKEILLLSSALSVLTLAAILLTLEIEMDQKTESSKALTGLVPLGLIIVVISITLCPFNIVYRTNRFFLLVCLWHSVCAPLYKVTLPDFFLADQLTSQVQLLRNLEFYVCYYGWGDFKNRSNRCRQSSVYQDISIIVAVVPYWFRFLQSLRRMFEGQASTQAMNGVKYFVTILAVIARTVYDQRKGMTLKIIAASISGVATVFSTYWDLVMDWGLLCRNSKNPWLRDKLILPNKSVYFVAMVLNVILRLAWMQTVLDFNDAPFLHRNALIAIFASLEIIRRGIWNFFRLENEHLNNVGKFRASKSVPLPFSYEDEDKDL